MTMFTRPATPNPPADLVGAFDNAGQKMLAVKQGINTMVFGQEEVIQHSLTCVLAGGHMLLIGVPGLAKTRLVSTMAKVLGLDSKRIQCTPDLMPSDIIGAEILEEVDYGRRNFRFIQGPVFCQLLMADEINRASPRTQSALLQAMQEQRVSVAGHEHAIPSPFHVLATQNPLEQEGTYPLPEAQLDRFLMQIDIDYPELDAERRMLAANTQSSDLMGVKAVLHAAELREIQQLVRQMPLSEKVMEGILTLVRHGRPEMSKLDIVRHYVSWGPGPRASQALAMTAKARALLDGRLAPSMDDVLTLAYPVLKHRMALSFTARADGVKITDVINAMKELAGNL